MVKWTLINKPNSKGGLGIKNFKLFNISLLCKWWWRLENEDGIWQELIKAKYKITHGIWRINLKQGSVVWKDLLKVKTSIFKGDIWL